MELLRDFFSQQFISRNASIDWYPWSTNLTAADFIFMEISVKQSLYKQIEIA